MDAILLAAGNSTRFGGNKMLYEVGGEAMVLAATRRLLALREEGLLAEVILVTQYDEVVSLLYKSDLTLDIVRNDRPEEGISLSLRLGLAHLLEKKPDSEACLFSVCDQPYLKKETVADLIARFCESDCGIAALSSKQESARIGNPVIFSRKYYGELEGLRGDRGGKRVLLRHPDDALLIPADPQELLDLDVRP